MLKVPFLQGKVKSITQGTKLIRVKINEQELAGAFKSSNKEDSNIDINTIQCNLILIKIIPAVAEKENFLKFLVEYNIRKILQTTDKPDLLPQNTKIREQVANILAKVIGSVFLSV